MNDAVSYIYINATIAKFIVKKRNGSALNTASFIVIFTVVCKVRNLPHGKTGFMRLFMSQTLLQVKFLI